MRKTIITKEWLADFYAQGVKPKYRGSLKLQAPGGKPQAPSTKLQAPSRKRQAP